MLEEGAAENGLVDVEARGDAGEIPDWFDGEFGHGQLAGGVEADFAVWDEAAGAHGGFEFGDFHVGFGDGDGGADFDVLRFDGFGEQPGGEVA